MKVNIIRNIIDKEKAYASCMEVKKELPEGEWERFLKEYARPGRAYPSEFDFNDFCDRNGYLIPDGQKLERKIPDGYEYRVNIEYDDGTVYELMQEEVLDMVEDGSFYSGMLQPDFFKKHRNSENNA